MDLNRYDIHYEPQTRTYVVRDHNATPEGDQGAMVVRISKERLIKLLLNKLILKDFCEENND